jgi:allantoinase
MTTLKDTPTTLMFHAEMIPPITDSVGDGVQKSLPPLAPHGELNAYRTFLESRPPAFETYAIEEILSMADLAPDLHLHIVHLSATECIPILRAAREAGINITAETCFHYLGLAADNIEDGDTRHKCCPPIRERVNQDGLWAELAALDSCIRTVVSDHSPCTPELKLLPDHLQHHHDEGCGCDDSNGTNTPLPLQNMHHSDSGIDMTLPAEDKKLMLAAAAEAAAAAAAAEASTGAVQVEEGQGDFFAAWGGISSVGLGLPILYSAAQARIAEDPTAPVPNIVDIVRLCSQATARQVGLSHRKGGLKVGLDGDVCVFDDRARWTLRTGDMRWKNRCSPWEGHEFAGRVMETWLRGSRVFQLGAEGAGFGKAKPVGQALLEKRTM